MDVDSVQEVEPKVKKYELDIDSVESGTEPDAVIPEHEGGKQAWLTVVGSSLVYFATFGIVNSFGFFQHYYQDHFLPGVPASTVSFVGTLQITLMSVLAAPAGSLFDCYGLTGLYIFSGISCFLALLCLSLIRSGLLWQIFLVQGVLLGVAVAFGTQPALVVVGHHFTRQRGLVFSIVAAAGSVGGVCFPVIFNRLANHPSIGFAWSIRVVATIVAVCYAIALQISSAKVHSEPLKSVRRLFDFRGFQDRRYSVLAAGAFVAMLGQFVPYYYITADPKSPANDYLLPLMNAASIIGRILGGLAADTTGPANTVYPMTILSGLLCLGTWAVTSSVPVLISFVSMYGFCSGVFIAVLPVIVAQISPAANLGGRTGAFYSVLAIAQLVGSPIGGALIETNGHGGEHGAEAYLGSILFAGFTLLVGGLILLVGRLLHDKDIRSRY